MQSAWRIVSARFTKTAFSGEGARRYPGRWHSRGVPIVYLAEYRSLAVLEILANSAPGALDEEYALVEASWDESIMERFTARALPQHWDALPASGATRALGDRWAREARTAVLAVPNVIIPAESNYLINPAHPDFARIRISKPERFALDRRLALGAP